MDAASAAAVWALAPQPGEHILDLCCAPGLKLCTITDALAGRGSVTGVDVSRTRLHVARKVAVKYQIGRPPTPPPLLPSTVGPPPRRSGDTADAANAAAASLPASASPSLFLSLSSPSSSSSSAQERGLACRLLCVDGVAFNLGPLAPWDGEEGDVVFDSRAYDWEVR
jgi:hypothetical protein